MTSYLDDSKFVLRYKSSLTRRWVFLDIARQREVSDPTDISMYLTAEQVEKVIPAAREMAKQKAGASGISGQMIGDIEAVNLKTAISDLYK